MSVSGPTGQNFEVLELLWRSGPAGVFPAQVQQERPRKHLFFGHLERSLSRVSAHLWTAFTLRQHRIGSLVVSSFLSLLICRSFNLAADSNQWESNVSELWLLVFGRTTVWLVCEISNIQIFSVITKFPLQLWHVLCQTGSYPNKKLPKVLRYVSNPQKLTQATSSNKALKLFQDPSPWNVHVAMRPTLMPRTFAEQWQVVKRGGKFAGQTDGSSSSVGVPSGAGAGSVRFFTF